ncbi:MAG: T9SS type A sorting domain-containing protein [bacterium]
MIDNKKELKIFILLFTYIILSFDLVIGQINISIPDSTVCYNYEFTLPVQINTSVDDTIYAYQFQFDYNPELVEIYGASQKGALTEEWGGPFYNSMSGEFRVAGFSAEPLYINAANSIDTLFFINIRVVKDIIDKTNITIPQVLFYDVQGQLETEISIESEAVLDIIHNESPYFIKSIEDIKLFEDSTYTFNIVSYISDPDNTIDELDFSLQGSDYFTVVYEDSNLTIIPDPNWSGVAKLILTVSDIYQYTDSDTFLVLVLPLDDDPLPFSLISPQDTTIQSGENEIEFFWEESVNVDKNDSITYTFYLGTDSTFRSGILREHTSLFRESILIVISLEEGKYYWSVKAEDSNGNAVWCNDKYRELIVPTTGIDTPDFNPVERFKLYQNYPNPFNSQTRIEYQLPQATNCLIEIFDIRGRFIKTLLDDYVDSGNHSVVWNGLDSHNDPLSSGVYLINFRTDKIIKQRKVLLVK